MDETHERTDENEEREFADVHRYLTEGIYRYTAPPMKRESYKEKQSGIDSSPLVSYIVAHVLRLRVSTSNKQYLNVCSNVREVDYCGKIVYAPKDHFNTIQVQSGR